MSLFVKKGNHSLSNHQGTETKQKPTIQKDKTTMDIVKKVKRDCTVEKGEEIGGELSMNTSW